MPKKPELTIKKMNLKERVKATFVLSVNVSMLTGALIFFSNVSGATIVDIMQGADTVYYSWRDLFIVLYFPVMGYFDILFFLFLFVPLTSNLAQLWYRVVNIVWIYVHIAFFITLPLSLYVSFYSLSDYYSCGLTGPFSNIHYVKDLKMCEQFEYHPEEDESDKTSILVTPADTKIK